MLFVLVHVYNYGSTNQLQLKQCTYSYYMKKMLHTNCYMQVYVCGLHENMGICCWCTHSDLEWPHCIVATQHKQPFYLAFKHCKRINLLYFPPQLYFYYKTTKFLSCSFFAFVMLDYLRIFPWKSPSKLYGTLLLLVWQHCSMIFIQNCHGNHTKFNFGIILVAI